MAIIHMTLDKCQVVVGESGCPQYSSVAKKCGHCLDLRKIMELGQSSFFKPEQSIRPRVDLEGISNQQILPEGNSQQQLHY